MKLQGEFRLGCFGAVFVLCCVAQSAGARMNQPLEVSAQVTKTEIRVGDGLAIIGTLRNVGDVPITVFRRPRLYSTLHVKVFGDNGKPMSAYRILLFEPAPISRADFVELKRFEGIRMPFEAVLTNQRIRNIEAAGKVFLQGLFLDFRDSAILIEGPGQYEMRFSYEIGEEIGEEWRKSHALPSLWRGALLSPPVRINVR